MTKDTYKGAIKKREKREFLINLLHDKFIFEKITGLPGPDIDEYVKDFEKMGCNDFELYENKSKTALAQLTKIKSKKSKISLICDDILNANPNEKSTLYDLDFCGSVIKHIEHIKKFKDNFIMTFSTRIGLIETIRTFFKARNEVVTNIYHIDTPIEHTIFDTCSFLDVFESSETSKYIFIRYKDTSAMCCFAKIK